MDEGQLERFEPRWPTLAALGFFCLWIAILSLPMLGGDFVAAPYNDQYATGLAFREWAASQWKALGHFPLWNPELYAGLPFVAAMHGDLFYPTTFLRLVLPTHVAMNLGFVIHYVLVGLFMYLLLRALRTGWTAAVVGGVVYQLSGVIGSYVSPGHDGKLFVTAMLPLGFLALVWALRDRRLEGYALFALSVGLALLSPHPQMAQYFLLAAGIFTLYLVFDGPDRDWKRISLQLGGAMGAVLLGVGISLVQYLPFLAYIPFSPRDEAVVADFAFSASYAIPWTHVPEFLVPRFAGEWFNGTYWGPNGIKLHSEYLGLSAIALAVFGAWDKDRRRIAMWLGGIALLFLLVAMGSATPFFRVWWEVVPFVKSTRAPGMALFVVSAMVGILAAFGVDRIERDAAAVPIRVWLWVGGAVAVLGLLGVFGAVAETMAPPELRARAVAGGAAVRTGALVAGVALMAVAALAFGKGRGRLPVTFAALGLVAVLGSEMWLNASAFWNYSRPQDELFADDEIKSYLRDVERPYRVWSVPTRVGQVYPQSALMADGIAQWYGHHGNELHSFDLVNARRGISLAFTNEGNPRLMDLYAIRYLIVPANAVDDSIPGFSFVFRSVPSSTGMQAALLERDDSTPYARVVPSGVMIPEAQVVPTLLDQRVPLDRMVVFSDQLDFQLPAIDTLPSPATAVASFAEWRPGYMRIELSEPAPANSFLVIAENWYKDWSATVDARPTPTFPGNGSLLTVPLSAGARNVELRFESREFQRGKWLTFLSLIVVLGGCVAPPVWRRRRA